MFLGSRDLHICVSLACSYFEKPKVLRSKARRPSSHRNKSESEKRFSRKSPRSLPHSASSSSSTTRSSGIGLLLTAANTTGASRAFGTTDGPPLPGSDPRIGELSNSGTFPAIFCVVTLLHVLQKVTTLCFERMFGCVRDMTFCEPQTVHNKYTLVILLQKRKWGY